MFKERLELAFLESLQLIQNKEVHAKKTIRTRTALLYKQNNFNLLREESEGYSKLAIEITECLPLPLDILFANEKPQPTSLAALKEKRAAILKETASNLMMTINGLIGFFDLDANRVLDMILDVFATLMADYWDFFLELLLISPWAPIVSSGGEIKRYTAFGQILGFKFSIYHLEGAGPTPKSLYWLAAILIKHKFVDAEQFFAHLQPGDDMKQEYLSYTKSIMKIARNAGRFAGSQMAGVLGDDKVTTESKKIEQAPESPQSASHMTNQKAGVIQALLGIGEIEVGCALLDGYPNLATMFSAISKNLSRLLAYMLAKIVADPVILAPHQPAGMCTPPPINSLDVESFQKNNHIIFSKLKKNTRTAFFYDRSTEQLLQATDFASALKLIKKYIGYSGANLYLDSRLYSIILRIGRDHLKSVRFM